MSNPELELSVDPVPTAVQELLTFFNSELAEVNFPDIDAKRLADLAELVRGRAHDLQRARQVLEEVRQGLEETREELEAKAKRALAYAQVYAEDKPGLAEQVDALALGRKKGRAGKKTTTPSELKVEPPKRRKRQPPTSLPLKETSLPLKETEQDDDAKAA